MGLKAEMGVGVFGVGGWWCKDWLYLLSRRGRLRPEIAKRIFGGAYCQEPWRKSLENGESDLGEVVARGSAMGTPEQASCCCAVIF